MFIKKPLNAGIPFVKTKIPYLGSGWQFGADADNFIRNCIEEHGDSFSLLLGGKIVHLITSPHDFTIYYKGTKGLAYDPIQKEVMESTFGVRKKYTQFPASELHHVLYKHLKGDGLDPLVAGMQHNLDRVLEKEQSDQWQTAEVQDFIRKLLFHAGILTIFGEDSYNEDRYKSFIKIDDMFPIMLGGAPSWLLPGVSKARKLASQNLDISRPKESAVVQASLNFWKSLGLDKKHTELMQGIFLWGAQANTTISAAWAAYYIFKDIALLARVREEVDTVLAQTQWRDDNGKALYTLGALNEMNLLDSAVWEAMRMSNSVMSMRLCEEDCEVSLHDGRTLSIKEGEYFSMYSRASHFDSEIYENPTEFQAERFIDKRKKFYKDGKPLLDQLSIFGGGESKCPGRFFAVSEIKSTLATFISEFDIEMEAGPDLNVIYSRSGAGTLYPDQKSYFKFKRRSQKAISSENELAATA